MSEPEQTIRIAPLAGLAAVALVVAIAVAAALVTTPPAPTAAAPVNELFRAGLAAAGRADAARARRIVRELRGREAATAAGVVESRLLLARGFLQPAIDGLDAVDTAAADDEIRRASLLVIAEAAARSGRHADVEPILAPLLTAHPDDVDAHRLLAASLYDIGSIDPAIHHLRETARLAPLDPRPHRLLGLIHYDYERYDDAIGFYEESLRRAPDQPGRDEVFLELAACQAKVLRHADALATLDRIGGSAATEPGSIAGSALKAAGATDAAQEGTGTTGTAAWATAADVLRAECFVALGRIDAARGLVDAVLDRSPDDLGGRVLEGTILLEDGRAAEAADSLERAVRGHPHDYVARLKLAQALDRAGRTEEAQAAREAAETIRHRREEFAELHREAWEHPRDPQVRLRLAEVAVAMGRPDLAEVWRAAAAAVEAAAPPAPARPPQPPARPERQQSEQQQQQQQQ
jgi:tetratricopeptide (TPR) repeat protein